MPLTEPTRLRLHTPQFPVSPAPNNGDTWVDPVTGVSWTFQSSTGTGKLTWWLRWMS